LKSVFLALAISVSAACAGVVSDSNLGYSITLPANWSQLKLKLVQHYFRDSTRHYRSQISILKYDIDPAVYPTAVSWTQAQFIAYKTAVETSAFPFGAVAYYDSTSAAKIGALWSPEAFSVLYPADGDPTYAEYVRYTAEANVGYEIYAIGDSTDMTNNVDFYAGIIASLQFTPPAAIKIPYRAAAAPNGHDALNAIFDLTGRLIPESDLIPAARHAARQRLFRKPMP
jgi:hypothetical protein